MRPSGFAGRLFAVVMEALNAPAYRFALDMLDLTPNSDVLDIGFGGGRMIELLLRKTSGRVDGVDPTATMVKLASARPSVRRARARTRLCQGADDALDFPPASFDRIVALHTFQFWAAPEVTVQRLRGLLRRRGRVVMILRDHSRRAPAWLPNPLSRGLDEPGATRDLFRDAGFDSRIIKFRDMVGVVGQLP
jgi:SAM-dependent methyltransferase